MFTPSRIRPHRRRTTSWPGWRAHGASKGGSSELRRYDVLHSRPRKVTLEMTAPVRYHATLREDPYDGDPDTRNPRD